MSRASALSSVDSVASRIEDILRRDEERGVCHTCLAATVDVSFEEVHTAIRTLRRQPHIAVELARCRSCHDDRVTIRLTTSRQLRGDTPESLSA